MIVSKKGSIECFKILAPYEIGLIDLEKRTALMHAVTSQTSNE